MSDTDLIKLYSGRILELAAAIPRTTRLDAPDATVSKRSPLCGSTVTVDIRLENGRIADYGQTVRACALGQAAASVVGASIVGCTPDQVHAARAALQAMLTAEGPPPAPPFDGLEALLPARDFRNRHASILLALEAASEAADTARNTACA